VKLRLPRAFNLGRYNTFFISPKGFIGRCVVNDSTVDVKRARCALANRFSASCGLLTPPPTTEFMLTWKVAMFGEKLQLLVENLQTFLRDLVRQ